MHSGFSSCGIWHFGWTARLIPHGNFLLH